MSQFENLSNAVETCVSLLKSGIEEHARFALEWLLDTDIPQDILAKYQIKELVEYLFKTGNEVVEKVLSKISNMEGIQEKEEKENCTTARHSFSDYSPIDEVHYKFFDYSPNFLRSGSSPGPVRKPQNLTFRGPRRNLKLQLLAQQAAAVDFKHAPIAPVPIAFYDYSSIFPRSVVSQGPARKPQNLTFRGPRRNLKLQLLAQQASGVACKCTPIDEVHYKFFDYSPNFLRSTSSPGPVRQHQNLTFRGPRRNLKLQLLAQQAAAVQFN